MSDSEDDPRMGRVTGFVPMSQTPSESAAFLPQYSSKRGMEAIYECLEMFGTPMCPRLRRPT